MSRTDPLLGLRVPKEILDALKERAKREGRSATQELIVILRRALRVKVG